MADHRGPDMVQVGLKKASIRFRNPQHILVRSGVDVDVLILPVPFGILQEGRAAHDISECNDVAHNRHGQVLQQNMGGAESQCPE